MVVIKEGPPRKSRKKTYQTIKFNPGFTQELLQEAFTCRSVSKLKLEKTSKVIF